MPDTMIERLAGVLSRLLPSEAFATTTSEEAASAVLTAMREPTEGMVEAGVVAMHQSAAYDDAVVAAHHAMIDAALAEEG